VLYCIFIIAHARNGRISTVTSSSRFEQLMRIYVRKRKSPQSAYQRVTV